jgi:hypothetical protein
MSQKEAISKAPPQRPRRTPIGQRQVLSVTGKEPGFHYRFVNDTSERVQTFLDNGWELVEQKDIRIGDKRVGNPTTEGTAAKAHVGQGQYAYVLRIRDEWYIEDQAEKQKYVDATEAAMKDKALDGTYGKLELTRD